MKRILIICNKAFEVDAVLSAVLNADIRHPSFDFTSKAPPFKLVYSEFPRSKDQGEAYLRAIFQSANYHFEIWCIQNIMTPNPNPSDSYYYSRSYQKAIDFPKILKFSTDQIALIVAFGTAGLPSEISKNGSVVVGSYSFTYDAAPAGTKPVYSNPGIGKLIPSTISQNFFDQLAIGLSKIEMTSYFETKTLRPPLNAPKIFQAIVDRNLAEVSDVNVQSYGDYGVQDLAAFNAFQSLKVPQTAYSIETTHGLIRLESKIDNFIFVSAITDRDAYFAQENTPKASAQNFSASFNGGIFLSWLIPFINNQTFTV